MDKIRKVVVTLKDGTERTFEGDGVSHVVQTTITRESWEGVPEDKDKPNTTVEPMKYLYIQFRLEPQ